MSTTYTGAAPETALHYAIVAKVLQILEAKDNGTIRQRQSRPFGLYSCHPGWSRHAEPDAIRMVWHLA